MLSTVATERKIHRILEVRDVTSDAEYVIAHQLRYFFREEVEEWSPALSYRSGVFGFQIALGAPSHGQGLNWKLGTIVEAATAARRWLDNLSPEARRLFHERFSKSRPVGGRDDGFQMQSQELYNTGITVLCIQPAFV